MLGQKKTMFGFVTLAVLSLGLAFGCGEKRSRKTPLRPANTVDKGNTDAGGGTKVTGTDGSGDSANAKKVLLVDKATQCERLKKQDLRVYRLTGDLSASCEVKEASFGGLESLCAALVDSTVFTGCTEDDKLLDKYIMCDDIDDSTRRQYSTESMDDTAVPWAKKLEVWQAACDGKVPPTPTPVGPNNPAPEQPIDPATPVAPAPVADPANPALPEQPVDAQPTETPAPENGAPPAQGPGDAVIGATGNETSGSAPTPENGVVGEETTNDGEEEEADLDEEKTVSDRERDKERDKERDGNEDEDDENKEKLKFSIRVVRLEDKEDPDVEDKELGDWKDEVELGGNQISKTINRSQRKIHVAYIEGKGDNDNEVSIKVTKLQVGDYDNAELVFRVPANKKAVVVLGRRGDKEGLKIEFKPKDSERGNDLDELSCKLDGSKNGQSMDTQELEDVDDEQELEIDDNYLDFDKKTLEVDSNEAIVTMKKADTGYLQFRTGIHPFRVNFSSGSSGSSERVNVRLQCGDEDFLD